MCVCGSTFGIRTRSRWCWAVSQPNPHPNTHQHNNTYKVSAVIVRLTPGAMVATTIQLQRTYMFWNTS